MTRENRSGNADAELRRAEETLGAAEALSGLGLGNDAASRAYYAAFHAASALLVKEGLQPRTHRGVETLLRERFGATGLLAPAEIEAFVRLHARRGVADYRAAETVSVDEARALVADARAFFEAARRLAVS